MQSESKFIYSQAVKRNFEVWDVHDIEPKQ